MVNARLLAISNCLYGIRSNNVNISSPYYEIFEQRGLLQHKPGRKIWMFCGDGEMDEPESLGAISLAARESLII